MKPNLLVCRSGGRSSEYMYKRLLREYSSEYNIVGIFANTGWEHHKTIEFVHNNDIDNKKLFDVDPVWVESVVHSGRVSCTHKNVTYDTAAKNMEPFIDVVKKYGIPNAAYPHCTRELKENPIHSYIKSIGWEKGKYSTALGIRIDEPKRLKYSKNIQNKVYPLADWFSDKPDKLDILDWWEDYIFDLGIPEHLGNCVGCFRKSERKCLKAYRDAPLQFDNTIEIDFGHVGSNKINGEHSDLPRTMYRNFNTTQSLISMFKDVDQMWLAKDDPEHLNEGCASSCEPFANIEE